ncbi:MAG: NFACT family protein, partial [Ruthenibacterium sp.]
QRRADGTEKIIDAFKRVDFEDSEVRQLLPGLAYTLPKPQDKLSFLAADTADILAAIAAKQTPVGEALMKATAGVGPAVCREAAFRAFGGREVLADAMTDAEKTALTKSIEEVRAIHAAGGQPTAVLAPDGRPTEFSFLPLTQYGDAMTLVPYEDFSQLLEGYYAVKDKAERLHQKSKDLAKTVRNAYDRTVRKQAARHEEQNQGATSDYLRVWGELLSANLWAFKRGDSEVTVTNYYDGTQITIPLDVRLTPSANAQKYFKE